MIYLYVIAALVVAYLCGSIPNAVWIGKRFWGIDVREHGSKNAGSTNVLRVLGRKAALPVFILDILKGFVAVSVMGLVSNFVLVDENVLYTLKIVAIFVAVLGHIFPIFAGFKGGKGVATLVGSIAALQPLIVLLCFVVWFVVFAISHYVSLSSMFAGCAFPIITLSIPATREITPLVIFSMVTAILLILTHRKNIGRLIDGTESRIYLKAKKEESTE